ncbi:substrate-binding domain-containing protein [Pseudonocardia eucalypti]|uniref:Substrate-binding domain-containing protein n=1 Tax=Pseudonocardia eucalypti TaxID=648755 RepID=A0ABP9PIA3_9PSEU|nr:ABC-type phosphate transport system substrate-binding protein [Pseudonocardia eucalypti]
MLEILSSALGTVQSTVEFLGPGNLVVAILALIATPYVDRLLIRRKRVTFRVLYNSKVGIGPELLHLDGDHTRKDGQAKQLAELLARMSVVVVRIRNTGSYDIHAGDFEKPLAFTFGGRVIWNARISDASDDKLRKDVREGLEFFAATAGANPRANPPSSGTLRAMRDLLPSRTTKGGAQAPSWQGVRLGELNLGRRQRFKLVVVLVEPPGRTGELTKGFRYEGKLNENGLIRDDKVERRVTLPRVTGVAAVALTGLLLAGLALAPTARPAAGVNCASGQLSVVGSSVFMPTLSTLADLYRQGCPGAVIDTRPTGSVDGVRQLIASEHPEGLVALSDGKQNTGAAPVRAEQLGIVVYHVVVNSSAGVDGLTSAQLRGIYDGTYRDWSQLRGGAPLPIRIVGRGQESGTRELFEQRVLHAAEPGLTSNDCLTNDRDQRAPIIRCERNANPEVIDMISNTPGAIGYSDAPSVAEARKSSALNALTLDNKTFDTNSVIESGYQFWTVEYLYLRSPDGLPAALLDYLRHDPTARIRLTAAGYIPCTTPDNAPLDLCNHR